MMKNRNYSKRRNLVVASWNVRSLVESSGDVRVCRSRQLLGEKSEVVDRKLDLLAAELSRYGVSVAGLQETRWFGKDIWPAVGGWTLLHSGRPVPGAGEKLARQEGVGIMLDE